MKHRIIILLYILLAVSLEPAVGQVSFGEAKKFNSDWRFVLSDNADYAATAYDDSKWRQLELPHDWSIEGALSPSLYSCTGYLPGGIAWYRKHFTIADDAARHYIYFEGVYNRSEVYLNGHLLGKRPNGYISFMYDMTPYLTEGENVLSVRVDHSRQADSRWYTGSGIYRDVWVIASGETHFSQWGIGWHASTVSSAAAEVVVDAEIDNGSKSKKLNVEATLCDCFGRVVAKAKSKVTKGADGSERASLRLKVKNPTLWNLDKPYLYTLRTELTDGGKHIDASETTVGLRTLTFDANRGFALNGEWTKIKGVCLHHDAGVLGSVVPSDVWERRLRNLKDIGVNAIRLSHNPQAPILYDLCDRMGLLVMDEGSDEWEYPKRKWLKGWNVGEPGFEGTFDFFEEWIERDVTDMVRRDRNHTSIFLWSVGNEVDYPNDPYSHPILDGAKINQPMFGGYKPDAPNAMRIGEIAKRLAACIKAVDTSRPVTGALAGVIMSNETAYPEAVDVVGYNYTEDRYTEDHATYPQRILYGSENSSTHSAWKAVRDNDYIFGQFIWTGTDYLGESGRWPSRGFYTGLLDFGSFAKPRGYFKASHWLTTPTTYCGTYPLWGEKDYISPDAPDIWNYDEGMKIRVVCYTNAPQARLMLNGKEVGSMKPYDDHTGIIYWDIPFEAGKLMAEGCDKEGNVLSSYAIQTSGRPYALRATADYDLMSDKREVAHVTVEVVDENGVMVRLADNNIACTIEGSGELLGLEGSDNSDMGDYTDNRQRAYMGRLLAYVRRTAEKGRIKVTFRSPLLESATVTINCE